MDPLEQVTVLMTLMRRLEQVMDHERGILGSMRLEALPDLQEEKEALAEAYDIELRRLRGQPERLAALEPHVRDQLQAAMREFQERLARNLAVLHGTHRVIEKVLKNIGDSLARTAGGPGYGAAGQASPDDRARVIAIAFNHQL